MNSVSIISIIRIIYTWNPKNQERKSHHPPHFLKPPSNTSSGAPIQRHMVPHPTRLLRHRRQPPDIPGFPASQRDLSRLALGHRHISLYHYHLFPLLVQGHRRKHGSQPLTEAEGGCIYPLQRGLRAREYRVGYDWTAIGQSWRIFITFSFLIVREILNHWLVGYCK